jgi:Ca2+-binding RTX toxin-like protein
MSFRAAYPDKPLYILKQAVGGSDLADAWDPQTGTLFSQTSALVNEAATGVGGRKPDVMFWGQGETDGQDQAMAQAYGQNLTDLFSAARAQWLASASAKIGFFQINGDGPYATYVQQGEVAVDLADANAVSFQTDPLPRNASNTLHFNNVGYDAIGAREFDIYASWQNNPRVGFSTASVAHDEGASGGTTYSYVVTRTGDASGAASVQWSVNGSGANAAVAADFTGAALPSGTLSFAAGENSKTLSFAVAADSSVEATETFDVNLTSATGALLGVTKAQGVIVNDDGQTAPPSGAAGAALASPGSGAALTGGWGADTLTAGQGNDTLTGGAGADVFVFRPGTWAPAVVTDFVPGQDKLDLRQVLPAGYSGDPLLQHYVVAVSDGAGGTEIYVDPDGGGPQSYGANNVADIKGVAPWQITRNELLGYEGQIVGGYNPNVGINLAPGASSGGGTGGGDTTGGGSTTSGQVYTASSTGSVLTGGAGNDTFNASQADDTLTGGAGADVFKLANEPWSPIHITDFAVGTDKLDLSALFAKYGYTGSDPVADGWIFLYGDGAGGTIVRFDHDGVGPNPQWPNTIIDLEHVSPTGLTWANLSSGGGSTGGSGGTGGTGGGDTTGGGSTASGQVYTATSTGSVLTGGAGNDTFNASQADDTLTGGAGADVFRLPNEPWSPIHITDFAPGTDKLDLSPLFAKYGYSGSDPIADGWVYLYGDGNGGTIVRFDRDGAGPNPQWPNTIIDLEHVSPTGLTWASLSGGGGSSGGAGGGTASPTVALSTTSLTLAEGASGATAFNYVVSRSGDTTATSTLNWAVTGSGANPANAADFQGGVLPSGTLSFAAGETNKTIVVNVAGDTTAEPNEGFTLTLSNASGATLGTATASGTIADDDTGGGGSTTSGQVYTASQIGSVLSGGAGNDTFNASQADDTLTGGGGADRFVLTSEPWSPIHITDFTPGQDKLDLSHLRPAGYTGTDPVADHWLFFYSDGAGGTIVRFDHDGAGPNPQWPNTIVLLEHVTPSQITSSDWIF